MQRDSNLEVWNHKAYAGIRSSFHSAIERSGRSNKPPSSLLPWPIAIRKGEQSQVEKHHLRVEAATDRAQLARTIKEHILQERECTGKPRHPSLYIKQA